MKKTSKIVLSGIQPTGELHVGNYLGSIINFIKLQERYQCFFFIADLHSLTEPFDPKEKRKQIFNLALDFLALGLDPLKCTIFIQSQIPAHSELAWIFNCLTPISWLKRMTQFKEKSKTQKENINTGLFTYPVLQAADILIYKANLVPVGKDQLQHLEFTRDIARVFNRLFGKTFPEPQPILTETPKIMSLLSPEKKMSKSLGEGHWIGIGDSPSTIYKKIKAAVTDIGPLKPGSSKKSAGVANLFLLLKYFGSKEDYLYFEESYKKGTIRYIQLKEVLAKSIANYFKPFREKRKELLKKKKYVLDVLEEGRKKAMKVANQTLSEVKKKIGLV